MKPKYTITVTIHSVNHCSYFFQKNFGSCQGRGGPIPKNKHELLNRFLDIYKDVSGYDGVLERDVKPKELPNPKNTTFEIDKRIKWIAPVDFWNALKYRQTTLF